MRRAKLNSCLVALALVLHGCSQWPLFGDLFGKEPPSAPPEIPSKPPEPVKPDNSGQAFYVGASSINVHADSKLSSLVVGRLSAYEAVTRTKIDGAYAYVTSAKSGLSGWVDNGQLIWRLPSMKETEPSSSKVKESDDAMQNKSGSLPQTPVTIQPPDPQPVNTGSQATGAPALKEPKMFNPF